MWRCDDVVLSITAFATGASKDAVLYIRYRVDETAAVEDLTAQVFERALTSIGRYAPDQAPFVREGDQIKVGDVVGLVEVMKMFNKVHADVAGRVVRILAENEAPVEAGQALVVVEA